MKKINEKKFADLRTSSERMNEKYGTPGTPGREAFEARAKSYYSAELS